VVANLKYAEKGMGEGMSAEEAMVENNQKLTNYFSEHVMSAPVFILVGALVRNMVVKKGKVKTRVKELVAA
jgi:hypothetical protein